MAGVNNGKLFQKMFGIEIGDPKFCLLTSVGEDFYVENALKLKKKGNKKTNKQKRKSKIYI